MAQGILSQTTVVVIDPQSKYFDTVLSLWRTNSAILGFLPKGAFEEFARAGTLLGAVFEDVLIGYVLYRISSSSTPRATIVHLCIDKKFRKQGTALCLMQEVKTRANNLIGIGLYCRKDFKVNNFWKKAGFSPISEKPGRSAEATILTFWWYDNGIPDLFSKIKINTKQIKAILDCNIIFDFADKTRQRFQESQGLLADWVTGLVEFAVTDEIFYEIDRGTDAQRRKENRLIAQKFPLTKVDETQFLNILEKIHKIIKFPTDKNSESDAKHLAHTILSNYQYLITWDQPFIERASLIKKHFDVSVISPIDFIIKLDRIEREDAYRSHRLGGSQISHRRISENDMNQIFDVFRFHDKNETKNDFKRIAHQFLVSRNSSEIFLYEDSNKNPILLIAYTKTENFIEISNIRIVNKSISETVLKNVLKKLILKSSDLNLTAILLKDRSINNKILNIVSECGFIYEKSGFWFKITNKNTGSLEKILEIFCNSIKYITKSNEIADSIYEEMKTVWESGNLATQRIVENFLSPMKIIDDRIPCFVIPIKPTWAMELFYEPMASQTLFGVDDKLLLNWENVYYRKKKNAPKNFDLIGSRILWYISNSKQNPIQAIVACSILEEIIVGNYMTLYERFRRLGIYRKKDLEKLAENQKLGEIMAIRFSNTEIFANLISFQEFNEILLKSEGKKSQIISPTRIKSETFKDLYDYGRKSKGK